MKISAIILGGGSSARMGRDKLYMTVGDETVFFHTVSTFLSSPLVDEVIAVTKEGVEPDLPSMVRVIKGGKTRAESSKNGINAASGDIVLIHDAARPFVTDKLIERVIACCKANRSAVPYIKLKDSIKKVKDGKIVSSPNREEYVAVQTPQAFYRAEIQNAYDLFGDVDATDDSHIYSLMYGDPYLVEGDDSNIKITTPIDIRSGESIGLGYDLHLLEQGRPFVLGGQKLEAPFGAVAHSDGDCLVHAVIDSLLAAAGLRDVGYYYPDTDPKYRGVKSIDLLLDTCVRVRAQGCAVDRISVIIVLDKPKLKDYIPIIKENISSVLGISSDRVAIAAKTTEKTAPDRIECFALAVLKM